MSAELKKQRSDAKGAKPLTPESASGLEKDRLDDQAVERAVTVVDGPNHAHSILPSPPISPNQQTGVGDAMVSDPSKKSRKKAKS